MPSSCHRNQRALSIELEVFIDGRDARSRRLGNLVSAGVARAGVAVAGAAVAVAGRHGDCLEW
ncbi:hypothetical protein BDW62DRAFT_174054 [Aspergillus aurantiobrunneus]